jgi:ATP-dependent helicase HepA
LTLPPFAPGQRWISGTEPELGLGLVADTANRRVLIRFPAADERRTYAVDNAPLHRVQYEVGRQVSTEDGRQITITGIEQHNNCLIYLGLDVEDQELVVPEAELDSAVQFNAPLDRLLAGQIDKLGVFKLRCETLTHQNSLQQSPVRGLQGPRVELLPHQLYIAKKTADRHAPRVLLADEVGLGKTIEAGLIMHQQLISGRASRVLVVVPESLLHQWLVEMLRRFNLRFTIIDEERCQALEESGNDNPFETAQLVLCSLGFLEADRNRQAVAASWDLLVVDEAHHLQWSENGASPAYQCIEQLAAVATGLLLLTATPEQLGIEGHFSRLRMLDPDRFHDLETFVAEEMKYRQVNELVLELTAEDAAERLAGKPEICKQLAAYLGAGSVSRLRAAQAGEEAEDAIEGVIQELLDRHGTGRVLFRNTRHSVSGFPERHLHRHPLPLPAELVGIDASLSERLAPEQILGDEWEVLDPRVAWLDDWLGEHRSEKALVICARASTALTLELHLRLRCGVHSAVFHEGLSLVARDRAAAYFSEQQEGAQTLICSEIGSEGRNFQFAQHLVLFDLPLNPDLLEQRIGRLDRIGQRLDVNIHVPYYQGSAQERLMRWYDEGLAAFEQSCAVGNNVLGVFESRLHQCLQDNDNGTALEQLIADTAEHTDELTEQLKAGRDRLLELNSMNARQADQIVDELADSGSGQRLAQYMDRVFDLFGVEQEHHTAVSTVLRPGDHMLEHSFPELPRDGVTITYSRQLALVREDYQFLTWEHPMVAGAMDMMLAGGLGSTTLGRLKFPSIASGTLLVETVFTLHCAAPAALQLGRYLPASLLRVILDSAGNDLSESLAPEYLDRQVAEVKGRIAQELLGRTREVLRQIVRKAEGLVQARQDAMIGAAVERMQQSQETELQRLQGLAAVNPTIRKDEIEHQGKSMEILEHHLRKSQLTLAAIRIMVVVQ